MKTTNLEEMRLAMETYYEEVCGRQGPLMGNDAAAQLPSPAGIAQASRQEDVSVAGCPHASRLSSQIHRLQTLLASSEPTGKKYDRAEAGFLVLSPR